MGKGIGLMISLASTVISMIITLAIYCQPPKSIRATVADATLSNLTLIQQQNVLSYKLTVHVTLYNPSARVNNHYDSLDAILRLPGMEAVLAGPANDTTVWLAESYQRHKTSDYVEVSFGSGRGGGGVIAGDMAARLHEDIGDGDGAVSFDMLMLAQMTYRSGAIKTYGFATIRCPLKIPVVVNKRRHGGGDVVVDGVLSPGGRCKVKYY